MSRIEDKGLSVIGAAPAWTHCSLIATRTLGISLAIAQLLAPSACAGAKDADGGALLSRSSAYALSAFNSLETQTRREISPTGDPKPDERPQVGQSAKAVDVPTGIGHSNDPNFLLLAGLAAYRSDEVPTALEYWKQSLDLAPNQALARVYERARREEDLDRHREKLYGTHVALRYEAQVIPFETARAVLSALDEDYTRISSQLGCASEDQIIAVVQSRETYLHSTSAAQWSGGQYDGRIHIAWSEETQFTPQIRRELAHEMVHACLTSIPSGSTPWPAWLQEGLAQRLSTEAPALSTPEQLRQFAQGRHIPRLEDLPQDWSRLSIDNARLAYKLALSAAELLYQDGGKYGIYNLLHNPETLRCIAAELDKKLGL